MTAESTLRVAIIGNGFQGKYHAQALCRTRRARVTVCCDADLAVATDLADQFDGCNATSDWEATIADPTVDAVVIATPTHTHTNLAIAAARAKKPMLLEKPMATTVDDCLRIEAAAQAARVPILIGFKFRFAPAVVQAKEAVPAGRVLSGQTLYDSAQITSSWVSDPQMSGGRVTSSLVHTVDLLRFLTESDPARVSAEASDLLGTGEPTTIAATIQFENGAIASILHGTSTQSALLSAWSFTTSTSEASATVFDHCRRVAVRTNGQDQELFVDEVEDPFASGMDGLAQAFVDSARSSKVHSPNGRDGVISLVTCRAIEEAARSGKTRKIEIPAPA